MQDQKVIGLHLTRQDAHALSDPHLSLLDQYCHRRRVQLTLVALKTDRQLLFALPSRHADLEHERMIC